MTLVYLGYVDQAKSWANKALLEARRLRHAYTLAVVLGFAARIELITRSPGMRQNAEELMALSTEHGFTSYLGAAAAYCGSSLAARGQPQEGLSLITQGLVKYRATGSILGTSGVLMWLAEAYAMLGQPLEGLNCLAEAAQIIEDTEERCDEAELHRLRGDLLNATGDPSAAELNYHRALAVARSQSAKLLELRASISLARLWRNRGKSREARDLLATIYGWFTEGLDAPVLGEAKTLLDELA